MRVHAIGVGRQGELRSRARRGSIADTFAALLARLVANAARSLTRLPAAPGCTPANIVCDGIVVVVVVVRQAKCHRVETRSERCSRVVVFVIVVIVVAPDVAGVSGDAGKLANAFVGVAQCSLAATGLRVNNRDGRRWCNAGGGCCCCLLIFGFVIGALVYASRSQLVDRNTRCVCTRGG
jgi:hypothetical protein